MNTFHLTTFSQSYYRRYRHFNNEHDACDAPLFYQYHQKEKERLPRSWLKGLFTLTLTTSNCDSQHNNNLLLDNSQQPPIIGTIYKRVYFACYTCRYLLHTYTCLPPVAFCVRTFVFVLLCPYPLTVTTPCPLLSLHIATIQQPPKRGKQKHPLKSQEG